MNKFIPQAWSNKKNKWINLVGKPFLTIDAAFVVVQEWVALWDTPVRVEEVYQKVGKL